MSLKEDVIEVMKLLVTKKMLMAVPITIWTGISQAIFTGSFVTMMDAGMGDTDWSSNTKLSMSLLAMIPLGLGEIIGGMITGKLLDKYGYKVGISWSITSLVV